MKKIFLAALSLAMLLLAGCSPSPTAIHVGSRKVDAAELAFYINYNKLNMENKYGYYSQGGTYDETITATIKNDALEQIAAAEIIRMKCKELELKLTDEEKQSVADTKADLIESLGGKYGYLQFLKESAMTDRTYDKYYENTIYYNKLFEHISTEAAKSTFNDEALRKYFADNYATVKYIRLSLVDGDGENLSETNAAALLIKANGILESARAEGASFDELITQNNDDTLMSENPSGIVVNELESRSIAYLEPVFELAENAVGGPYRASDGYYIVKRMTVHAEYFDAHKEEILQSALESHFTDLQAQWKSEITVTTTGVFKKINLTNLFDYVK